jgi:hypothetical protein
LIELIGKIDLFHLILSKKVADVLLSGSSSLGHIRRLLFLQELFHELEVIRLQLLRQSSDVVETSLPVFELGLGTWASGVLHAVTVAVHVILIAFGARVVLQSLTENIEPLLEFLLIFTLFLLLGHSFETLFVKDTDVEIIGERFNGLVQVDFELVGLLHEFIDLVVGALSPVSFLGGADHTIIDVVHE